MVPGLLFKQILFRAAEVILLFIVGDGLVNTIGAITDLCAVVKVITDIQVGRKSTYY